MSPADEGAAGISASPGDEGTALQWAQDKIATMQVRPGALDELPQSGVLEDVGSDTDDSQQELDEAGSPPASGGRRWGARESLGAWRVARGCAGRRGGLTSARPAPARPADAMTVPSGTGLLSQFFGRGRAGSG